MRDVDRYKQKIEEHEMNFNALTQTTAAENCECLFKQKLLYMLQTLIIVPNKLMLLWTLLLFEMPQDLAEEFNLAKATRRPEFTTYAVYRGLYVNRNNILKRLMDPSTGELRAMFSYCSLRVLHYVLCSILYVFAIVNCRHDIVSVCI